MNKKNDEKISADCGLDQKSQKNSTQTSISDWLGEPPNIAESEIKRTLQADVVIIGAGVAGLHTARAASEAGASVIVVEKADTYQYRSGQYGSIDNKIQKAKGIKIDKREVILETMKQMGYRADHRIWKYWADHSGEDFDWLLELTPEYHVFADDDLSYDREKINIQLAHFPAPPTHDPAKEYSPGYPTALIFLPDQGNIIKLVYQRCLEKGTKFIFSTRARKLIRPNSMGRVEGVICQDAGGAYIKVLAGKAVVLATGDYGNNKAMLGYFCPWGAVNYVNLYPNKDAEGNPLNLGEGHKLGVWAGGKIEDVPHAPMTHTLGGPLGVDAYFLANTEGKRFMNEDVAGQQLSNALMRQPGGFGWQIFDDKWPEQLEFMGVSHGSVNHFVTEDKNPKTDESNWLSIGKTSYMSREALLEYKDEKGEGVVIANTLNELTGKLGLDSKARQTMLDSIKRYNELCSKGVDEDFFKTAKRLFPVTTPPFYAAKIYQGIMLVCMGGLNCNPETGNVYDKDFNGIEGLYVVGNAQGGRFAADYPVVAPGASLGMALTCGRLVGTTVAKL